MKALNNKCLEIPGNICFVSLYLQFTLVDTFVHVVVLAAPAPVLVGEPIDQSVLRWRHRWGAAEYFWEMKMVFLCPPIFVQETHLYKAGHIWTCQWQLRDGGAGLSRCRGCGHPQAGGPHREKPDSWNPWTSWLQNSQRWNSSPCWRALCHPGISQIF